MGRYATLLAIQKKRILLQFEQFPYLSIDVINHNVTLMLSGGIGSAAAAAYLLDKGYAIQAAVFVNRGQVNARPERIAAEAIAAYLGIRLYRPQFLLPDLAPLSEETKERIGTPARNLIVSAQGLPYAYEYKSSFLALGNTKERDFPDCDFAFRKLFSSTVSHALAMDFVVCAPLADWAHMDKAGSIRWLYQNGFRALLPLTWTCWENDNQHCGICSACMQRREAFTDAHIKDPAKYRVATPQHVNKE